MVSGPGTGSKPLLWNDPAIERTADFIEQWMDSVEKCSNMLLRVSSSVRKFNISVCGDAHLSVKNDFFDRIFKRGNLVREGKARKLRKMAQDKGHTGELKAFVEAIKKGKEVPISFKESFIVTMVTFNGSVALVIDAYYN